MNDSLEPGAQLEQNDVDWLRTTAEDADEINGDYNQALWPEARANLERIASLIEVSLSRPLPDPELREKIARLLYDRFIGLRRNAEEAAAEILALVLGVDGSAETGKTE